MDEPPVENSDLRSLIQYSAGGVVSKVIVKSDRLNVTLFCMAAGTDIGEHTATREGMVHVIEGDGVFTIDGKPVSMRENVLIHLLANRPHSIVAHDNTAFLLTLVG